MSDQITIAGLAGPVAMLPDPTPLVVGMPDGSSLSLVFSAQNVEAPVGVAPTVTALGELAGRTLTVTVTGSAGTPAPTFTIAITANGSPVTPTVVSPGVWAYTAPGAASVQLNWTVTASNGTLPNATVSGIAVVPSNAAAPAFIQQPEILAPLFVTSDILLDLGQGDTGSTVEAASLTFNGADILGRLETVDEEGNPVAPRVDVSDLFIYGQTNTLALQTRATNSGGSTLSNTVSATVTNIPAQMAAPVVTATNSSTISVDRAAAPDTGGSSIIRYDLRWTTNINASPVSWVTVEGVADPEAVSGFSPSTQVWVQTRAVNAGGPGPWSAEDDATTAAGTPEVNPAFEQLVFVPGGAGSPDQLQALGYTYTGTDDVNFKGVTSTSAIAPSRSNIDAGTGTGTLEEFTVSSVDLTTIGAAIAGLTAASEAATYVHGYFGEDANGGFSVPRTVAVSNLDFTAPTLVSGETNLEGTLTTLILSESVVGTAVVGNWVLDADAVPVTISNVSISGSTITLTHAAVANGDVLTVSYSGGNVRDVKGNPLAAIVDAEVTNNVPPSLDTWDITAGDAFATITLFPAVPTSPAWNITAGNASATITSYPGQV